MYNFTSNDKVKLNDNGESKQQICDAWGVGINNEIKAIIQKNMTKDAFKSGLELYSVSYIHRYGIGYRENGLQSLSPHFGRVSISKSSIPGQWGAMPYL